MAGEIEAVSSEFQGQIVDGVASGLLSSMANLPGVSMIIGLVQAIGAVVLIWLILLIVKAVAQLKQTARMKSIEKNVKEINQKIDVLTRKKTQQEKKK